MMEYMVRFAGDDAPKPIRYRVPPTPEALFFTGHDTMNIAAILDISEAQALRRLTVLRSKRLGLPDPYKEGQGR